MSTAVESTETSKISSPSDFLKGVRGYLTGRRGLIVLAVAVIGGGLALNWGWLVAAGVAPLLLAVAPCAAMCALGLCMNKMGGKSCSSESGPGATKPSETPNERS